LDRKHVSIGKVPDARIEKAPDGIVKITNICGSDLHMYEGRTDVEKERLSDMRIWARA